MGGLLLILPTLAFDIWLAVTTGKRQWRRWREKRAWRAMALAALCGVALAIGLTFVAHFGPLRGFPIPWQHTSIPPLVSFAGAGADFLTGLVLPLVPFKVKEFIKEVKAELK